MEKTFLLQKDNSKAYCKKTQGITLIALVVTIVLNCSFLAMVVKS